MYNHDYQVSLKKEIEFEKYLRTQYPCITENSQNKGRFADWDIKTTALTTSIVISYEIKYNAIYFDSDLKSETVVIESGKSDGKSLIPTGLLATKADYYVISFEKSNLFHIIETKKLKELCNNPLNRKVILDKNNYRIYIFKKDYFLSHCIII